MLMENMRTFCSRSQHQQPVWISPKHPAHYEEDESLFSVESCAAQLDRKIYHLTLREGYCARFDDRTHCGFLWPSQKKKQWHRSRFSNAL